MQNIIILPIIDFMINNMYTYQKIN